MALCAIEINCWTASNSILDSNSNYNSNNTDNDSQHQHQCERDRTHTDFALVWKNPFAPNTQIHSRAETQIWREHEKEREPTLHLSALCHTFDRFVLFDFICLFAHSICAVCYIVYIFRWKTHKKSIFVLIVYLFVLLWHFASHLDRTLDVWGRFYLHVFFQHFNWEQMESGWIRVRRIKNVLIVCRQLIWQNHPIKKQ